tara:strand:+ start:5581 stop:5916 length:336 start_codon:yes stop_codon:yes gene_type:complete
LTSERGERRRSTPPTRFWKCVVFPSLVKNIILRQKKTSRREEEEEKKREKKPQDKKREREKEERKKEVHQHDTKNHHHQYTMGISRDSLHKRRATGGKLKPWRKARKYVSF